MDRPPATLTRFVLQVLAVVALAWLAARLSTGPGPRWTAPDAPAEPGVLHLPARDAG